MHFSLSLRLCYTAIRPFCDRAAASSKEVKYFVWFSIFEVWQESYLWQTGSWDQARRLQQLPPKHGELLHRPSSPLSWMQELCQLPISMHCRQKPTAPRSTLSVGLVMKFTKELVPLKQVVKLRRDLSANDTSRHPKLLKIGPNHQCQ